MIGNEKQKRGALTLKSLEAKLCHLPRIAAFEKLKDKLLTGITETKANDAKRYPLRWRRRSLGIMTAAAAVLILASILIPYYNLAGPSQTSIAGLNDLTRHFVMTDQNNAAINDAEPCGLQWQSAGHNEPVF